MTDDDEIDDVMQRVRQALAGHPPDLVGAVLADALALWLAGHVIPGDISETDRLRRQLLRLQIEMIETLIPILEATDQRLRPLAV